MASKCPGKCFCQLVPKERKGTAQVERIPEKTRAGDPFSFVWWLLKESGILTSIVNDSNSYREYGLYIDGKLTPVEKKQHKKQYKRRKRNRNAKDKTRGQRNTLEQGSNDTLDDVLQPFQNECFTEQEIEEASKKIQIFRDWERQQHENSTWAPDPSFSHDDITRYLLATVIMGLMRLPSQDCHWQSNNCSSPLFRNPVLPLLISRNKFHYIHKYIHYDISIMEKFLFQHGLFISIDEGLHGFKGLAPMKQYLPAKPDKHGLKYYALCASETGYMFNFFWYLGKSTTIDTSPSGIVKELLMCVDQSKHVIFVDNYYGSLALAEEIDNGSGFFVMTCRADRPTALFKQGLYHSLVQKGSKSKPEKGTWTALYSPNSRIIALAFCDKKIVYALSNAFTDSPTMHNQQLKPHLIKRYNKGMGGVDLFDMYMHLYPVYPHRRHKYTRDIYFAMFNMLFVNAWLLWKQLNPRKTNQQMSYRQFLEQVIRGYLVEANISTTPVLKHFPYLRKKGSRKKQDCQQCLKNGTRSSTSYVCTGCPRGTFIHPQCMAGFHNK